MAIAATPSATTASPSRATEHHRVTSTVDSHQHHHHHSRRNTTTFIFRVGFINKGCLFCWLKTKGVFVWGGSSKGGCSFGNSRKGEGDFWFAVVQQQGAAVQQQGAFVSGLLTRGVRLGLFWCSRHRPVLSRLVLRQLQRKREQIIKKKADIILSLQSELASPEVKGSLDVDEDIGVDEVSSTINGVFDSEVVVSDGEALGVDEDEPNRVISVLKDGGGEFDDNIDEINLGLSEECVIRVLEDRYVSGEKSREVFSITPWAAKGERMVLCYVQGSRRRKRKKSIGCSSGRRDYALLGALVFPLFNPGPGSFAHKRIWDLGIKIVFKQHLEGKVVSKE
nr:hypothetical protein [Tanacetum cinerariifolium]